MRLQYTTHANNTLGRSILLSKYRHILGVLMEPTYGGKSIAPNDSRQHNIRELVDALDVVLRAFATGRSDNERLQNLTELLKRGARFGYTISTQPTEWAFDWDEPQRRQTAQLVVYPALLQIADDQGRLHATPQHFGEAAQTVSMS